MVLALGCWASQVLNVRISLFIELDLIRCVTGTPSYISRIKPGRYPLVLRNLHIPSIVLNSLMMLLVLAIIPLDVVQGGANVLSVLAQEVSIQIVTSLFEKYTDHQLGSLVCRLLVTHLDRGRRHNRSLRGSFNRHCRYM